MKTIKKRIIWGILIFAVIAINAINMSTVDLSSSVKLGEIFEITNAQAEGTGSTGNPVECFSSSRGALLNRTYYDCGPCTKCDGKGTGTPSNCVTK